MSERVSSSRRPGMGLVPGARAGALRLPAAVVLLVDVFVVLVFAAVGRASHDEVSPVLGVLGTAWPFLTGVGLGWTLVLLRTGAAPRVVRSAVPVWLGAVAVGMLLRALTGRGVAFSFIVVATIVLGAFLLGWRTLGALLHPRSEVQP